MLLQSHCVSNLRVVVALGGTLQITKGGCKLSSTMSFNCIMSQILRCLGNHIARSAGQSRVLLAWPGPTAAFRPIQVELEDDILPPGFEMLSVTLVSVVTTVAEDGHSVQCLLPLAQYDVQMSGLGLVR
eukprot:SAG31_NODE_516_length_14707_cov_3.026629_5_plen_129_part_00